MRKKLISRHKPCCKKEGWRRNMQEKMRKKVIQGEIKIKLF